MSAALPKGILGDINDLTDAEAYELLHDWSLWGRPEQQPPAHRVWTYWLILAGRGWGKTRTGAEWVRSVIKTSRYVNLIGATADDARDIMIEGESGILAICPKDERPTYKKSERKLVWPNGANSLIFTADEPERLRGKQHEKIWADELAAWRYPESWDQANFGLRLGMNPQACITTTPRPTKIIREIAADPNTVITVGTTYDNKSNLPTTYFNSIIRKYEGTRLGRQELNAEILSDNPNALWKRSDIEDTRMKRGDVPAYKRIVVGVDPAVTHTANSDLAGIVVVALGTDDHAYVLADNSIKGSPDTWGRVAVNTYTAWEADRIVAEVNNGGDLVESLLRTIDTNIAYRDVRASRGKITRAEPIAALYEQHRVHHVGFFPEMEDEMCDYDPLTSKKSPDRMDALVWAITDLFAPSDTGLIEYALSETQRTKEAR